MLTRVTAARLVVVRHATPARRLGGGLWATLEIPDVALVDPEERNYQRSL